MLKNSNDSYGWLAIGLHWISVFFIVVLFSLGLWLDELDYYDAYNKVVPYWHKSLGVVFFCLVIFRTIWRLTNIQPVFENSISNAEQKLAKLVQYAFYILMWVIPVSGFAVATSEGDAVDVFDWFSIPSIYKFDNSSDIVSNIHGSLAWLLIVLVVIHGGAALKHHYLDKDNTLRKIFGMASRR